jgi:succinyl-CoA synthetase beta subunit
MFTGTGGTAPINLAALIANGGGWLGTASRGKYINPFVVTAANQGNPEYYIAVYIEKTTKKPAAQSNEDSATIE